MSFPARFLLFGALVTVLSIVGSIVAKYIAVAAVGAGGLALGGRRPSQRFR